VRTGNFVTGIRFWALVTLATSLSVGAPVHAEGLSTKLDLNPDYLKVEVKKDDKNILQEARFNSGLGLQFRNDLLQFAVDYKAQVRVKNKATDSVFSQQVGASLHSNALNRLLGVNANIRTGSTIKQGGDTYHYSVTPGFSKSFSDLAKLSVQYQYMLDKANAAASKKEKSGFRMGLSGKAQQGRLTWKGNYGTTDVFGGSWQLQSTEMLAFESRYQLAPELRLELSGRSKDETLFARGLEHDIFNETRYGAGLAWSPSQYYSVALKLNKSSESRYEKEDIFGSGILSWFPSRELEFTVSYGDHLIGGARAFMLGTKVDISGS
jgi:uncharacterized protein (PEP-CTERM system associated)